MWLMQDVKLKVKPAKEMEICKNNEYSHYDIIIIIITYMKNTLLQPPVQSY